MSLGRIAVAAGVWVEAIVGRTEIGGRNDDRSSGNAPPEVIGALHLVAGATDLAPVEQNRAQRGRGLAIAAFLQIAVPAGTAHSVAGIRRRVVGGAGRTPL